MLPFNISYSLMQHLLHSQSCIASVYLQTTNINITYKDTGGNNAFYSQNK